MVQTKEGAARNPWIRQIKRCAGMYHEEREARAKAPRRRLNAKSPEEALYKMEAPAVAAPKPAPKPAPPPKPAAPPPPTAAASKPAAAPKPAAAAKAEGATPIAAAAAGPQVVSTLPLEARRPLLKFVNKARAYLQKLDGRKTTAARLFQELSTVGDLKEALKDVGLPVKTPIVSFVKAFPQFALETGASGGASHVVLR
jgi:hypothetical protein